MYFLKAIIAIGMCFQLWNTVSCMYDEDESSIWINSAICWQSRKLSYEFGYTAVLHGLPPPESSYGPVSFWLTHDNLCWVLSVKKKMQQWVSVTTCRLWKCGFIRCSQFTENKEHLMSLRKLVSVVQLVLLREVLLVNKPPVAPEGWRIKQ